MAIRDYINRHPTASKRLTMDHSGVGSHDHAIVPIVQLSRCTTRRIVVLLTPNISVRSLVENTSTVLFMRFRPPANNPRLGIRLFACGEICVYRYIFTSPYKSVSFFRWQGSYPSIQRIIPAALLSRRPWYVDLSDEI